MQYLHISYFAYLSEASSNQRYCGEIDFNIVHCVEPVGPHFLNRSDLDSTSVENYDGGHDVLES